MATVDEAKKRQQNPAVMLQDGQVEQRNLRDASVTEAKLAFDVATQAELNAHVAAGDPHTGYRLESADHSHASSGLQGGTIDHGALTGLGDDDHTQYATNTEFDDHSARHEAGGSDVVQAFPVGSVFISVVSTNPNTLLGYGTWTAFATGRTLVGIDAGQVEFDTVEETGGAKTHTLSTSEMPAHDHGAATGVSSNTVDDSTGTARALPGVGTSSSFLSAHTHPISSQGGDGAHNNLQPYIVVYMWKRTA